jgi:hypothetical protein
MQLSDQNPIFERHRSAAAHLAMMKSFVVSLPDKSSPDLTDIALSQATGKVTLAEADALRALRMAVIKPFSAEPTPPRRLTTYGAEHDGLDPF